MSDLSKENEQEINELVFDENDDGFLDNVISFDRNSLGKITKVVLDFEWDDVPDMAIYFEYDNKGRIQRKLIDKNMSGNINAIVEYVYDDLGHQTILYDDNADGKADFVEYKNELNNVELHDIRPKFQKFTDFLKDIVGKERFEK